ncbi:hypothetical protein CP08DC60_1191A, partial [Chlamydia psittaci 08DC60]
MIRFQL